VASVTAGHFTSTPRPANDGSGRSAAQCTLGEAFPAPHWPWEVSPTNASRPAHGHSDGFVAWLPVSVKRSEMSGRSDRFENGRTAGKRAAARSTVTLISDQPGLVMLPCLLDGGQVSALLLRVCAWCPCRGCRWSSCSRGFLCLVGGSVCVLIVRDQPALGGAPLSP